MSAAEDIHAGYPEPFTGRAAPPADVRADNDDALALALRALPDFIFAAVMGYRLHRRKAQMRFDKTMAVRRAAELSVKPAPRPRDVETKLEQAREARSKAAALREADAKGNRQAIKDHETAAKLLEIDARDLQRQAEDDDWSFRADKETAQLATSRGETVEKTKRGQTRIMTRAGIQQAYEDGYMDPRQGQRMKSADLYETAKRYRDAYETITGRTSPSGSGNSGYGSAPQVRLAEAGEQLATMRIGLTKLEIEVLDHVCGLEMRAREAAIVLRRGFPKVRDALRDGLTTATMNMRAARATKDTGDSLVEHMKAMHPKIEAAMRAVA